MREGLLNDWVGGWMGELVSCWVSGWVREWGSGWVNACCIVCVYKLCMRANLWVQLHTLCAWTCGPSEIKSNVSRSEWDAKRPRGGDRKIPAVPNVFILHSASGTCDSTSATKVRCFQNYTSWTANVGRWVDFIHFTVSTISPRLRPYLHISFWGQHNLIRLGESKLYFYTALHPKRPQSSVNVTTVPVLNTESYYIYTI